MTDVAFGVEFGRRIQHERIQSQIKQEDLAARCGISRQALVRLEKGDVGVRLRTVIGVLRQLRLLENFEVMVPPADLTPNEIAELIQKGGKKAKKRVRDVVRHPERKVLSWGDGTLIER